jgi:hypothetical protein
MAGRKITQLPTLTIAAATDKLVIVDVSDTSESPQGTSKQIAVSNLGLSSIESSTLDVSIADGVATVNGRSGTWTPTITNETNDATVNAQESIYSRTGNVVTFCITVSIGMDAASSSTSFNLSVPIASNFSDGTQAAAAISSTQLSLITSVLLSSDSTNNNLECQITAANNGDNLSNVVLCGQYRII